MKQYRKKNLLEFNCLTFITYNVCDFHFLFYYKYFQYSDGILETKFNLIKTLLVDLDLLSSPDKKTMLCINKVNKHDTARRGKGVGRCRYLCFSLLFSCACPDLLLHLLYTWPVVAVVVAVVAQ